MSENILIILAPYEFSDVEYHICKEIFEQQQYKVEVVSATNRDCISDRGKSVFSGRRASEVKAEDYDIVVLIGGYGVSDLLEDHGVSDVLVDADRLGIVIGAIGLATKVLAHTGILNDRKATTTESSAEYLKHQGVNVVNQNVATDGNIVTAKDSEDADEFAYALLDAI